jgi:flagellin
MASLLTNVAALTVLQNLASTQRDLTDTQKRISSGLKVGDASQNAAYWSIATTMKSDNSSLSAVKDGLALGSATIDVVNSALTSAVDVVNQIKAKLVTASEPGVDRTKIQTEVTSLQQQLQSIADSAVFSGQNWLSVDSSVLGYNAQKSIIASFSRDNLGVVQIGTIDVDTTNVKLYDVNGGLGLIDRVRTSGATTQALSTMDISTLTDSTPDRQTLSDYLKITDAVLSDITAGSSTIGAYKTRVAAQSTFVSGLMDSITRGVGSLVDADMNQESARLQALQVQQQLGVQSLSIANQNVQLILKLFGGG